MKTSSYGHFIALQQRRNPAVTTTTAFLTFKYLENSPTMKIINFLREYSYPVLSLPGENSLLRTLHCTTRDNKQILCTITTVTASLTSKHLQNSLEGNQLCVSREYSYPVPNMTTFLTFKHHENSPTMKIINFLREYSYPVLSLLGENSLLRTLHCTTRDNKQILCTITTVTASLTTKHLQNSLQGNQFCVSREYSYPVLSLPGESSRVQTLHCTTIGNKHRNPAITTMTAFLTFKHHENSPTMKIINFLREYSYPVLSLPGENSLVRTLHCTTRDNKQILCTITTVTASLAFKTSAKHT